MNDTAEPCEDALYIVYGQHRNVAGFDVHDVDTFASDPPNV